MPTPPKPPPAQTELFASPQDAQDRADALLDRWNALINQAVGPGVQPRKDVPKDLQQQIINDRARFKTFITRPTFGFLGVLAPQSMSDETTDYRTLKKWYEKYDLRAQQVATALPSDETLSAKAISKPIPRKRTGIENLELATKGARALAIGAGAAGVLALILALAWNRSKS